MPDRIRLYLDSETWSGARDRVEASISKHHGDIGDRLDASTADSKAMPGIQISDLIANYCRRRLEGGIQKNVPDSLQKTLLDVS